MFKSVMTKLGKHEAKAVPQDLQQVLKEYNKCVEGLAEIIQLSLDYREKYGADTKDWPMSATFEFMDHISKIGERMV